MNLFHLTPDGGLDRQYLRIAAVYRCLKRYGMSREQALARLVERKITERDADALLSIWSRK